MFSIEPRRSSSDVCPRCEDIGVVLPAMRKLLTDSGQFCSCPIGVAKWEATKEKIGDIEQDLASSPSLPRAKAGPPEPYRSYRVV